MKISAFTLLTRIERQLIDDMTMLYITWTTPYSVLNKETNEVIEQGVSWTNEQAERLYINCQNYLQELKKIKLEKLEEIRKIDEDQRLYFRS